MSIDPWLLTEDIANIADIQDYLVTHFKKCFIYFFIFFFVPLHTLACWWNRVLGFVYMHMCVPMSTEL